MSKISCCDQKFSISSKKTIELLYVTSVCWLHVRFHCWHQRSSPTCPLWRSATRSSPADDASAGKSSGSCSFLPEKLSLWRPLTQEGSRCIFLLLPAWYWKPRRNLSLGFKWPYITENPRRCENLGTPGARAFTLAGVHISEVFM